MDETKRRGRPRERTYTIIVTETTICPIRVKAKSATEALRLARRAERNFKRRIESPSDWVLLRPKREISADLGPLPD